MSNVRCRTCGRYCPPSECPGPPAPIGDSKVRAAFDDLHAAIDRMRLDLAVQRDSLMTRDELVAALDAQEDR